MVKVQFMDELFSQSNNRDWNILISREYSVRISFSKIERILDNQWGVNLLIY